MTINQNFQTFLYTARARQKYDDREISVLGTTVRKNLYLIKYI